MKKQMVALAAAQYTPLHMGLYSALLHRLRKKSGGAIGTPLQVGRDLHPACTLLHVEEKLVAL